MRKSRLVGVVGSLLFVGVMNSAHGQQMEQIASVSNGIHFPVGGGELRIKSYNGDPNILRVTFSPDRGINPAFFGRSSFAVLPEAANGPQGQAEQDQTTVTFATPSIKAVVNTETGAITFQDASGKAILAEAGRTIEPAEVQGEQTHHVRQQWLPDEKEALYGLGQHQFGLANIKGYDIDLWQHNTEIAIPLLVSSKGYGIFWDNTSLTKFGDPREFAAIPADHLVDAGGNTGGLTETPFSGSNWGTWTMGTPGTPRVEAGVNIDGAAGGGGGGGRGRRGGFGESALRWEGQIKADAAGTYQFRLYANGGYKMWLDDKLVADHWRQNWLPWDDITKAEFASGSLHKLKVEWIKDGGSYCRLTWQPPAGDSKGSGNTSLWSQVGGGIDYYFIYGGGSAGKPATIDNVIAGYRKLTGQATMMPAWAFGLWQSRQRYETQQQSLDVVKQFRDRKIPFDNIVQDWMYWPENSWGSQDFDPERFPNPDQWVKDIHALNAHLMISVWGKYYPTTDNYKAMNEKGYMYPISPVRDWVGRGYQYAFYDAFNPGAREMFWDQVNKKIFSKGVDAWWMDATEPDLVQPSPPTYEKMLADAPKTAAGNSAAVLNAYPLLNSEGVYEGQRKAAPDQRVFILTRCGFAGQQRDAAAVWSGDISSTWSAMKKQIAAGLGYSISGMPYWTMDSGGFSVPSKFWRNNQLPADARDEWNEMNTRWLQFAAFVPLMRVHGESPHREMWEFTDEPGGDPEKSATYQAQLKIDRLRYRLLPYIYSVAGDVTQNGGTFMRPLVMDFPNDPSVRDVADQYMFGPAFLVSPVTEYKARSRMVAVPGTPGGWYDFWSGRNWPTILDKSTRAEADAPFDEIPLHVRAGSIVPLGPELQYITEKKADPLTVYVYAGADGDFSLYEDDGLTYGYEKGAFSRIPMHWSEKDRTLSLGKHAGTFPGMLASRTIRVILVAPGKPVAYGVDAAPDRTATYTGDAVDVKF